VGWILLWLLSAVVIAFVLGVFVSNISSLKLFLLLTLISMLIAAICVMFRVKPPKILLSAVEIIGDVIARSLARGPLAVGSEGSSVEPANIGSSGDRPILHVVGQSHDHPVLEERPIPPRV